MNDSEKLQELTELINTYLLESRSPLSMIMGASELLHTDAEANNLSDEQKWLTEILVQKSSYLDILMNMLMAHIKVSAQAYQMESHSICEFVEKVTPQINALHHIKETHVTTPDCKIKINYDRFLFSQVFVLTFMFGFYQSRETQDICAAINIEQIDSTKVKFSLQVANSNYFMRHLVIRILELHNSQLKIEEEKESATISFCLPIAKPK